MNRIYYSKISDPEEFPDCKVYWFPNAEWLMGRKWGIVVIKVYLTLREFFEEKKIGSDDRYK